MGEEEKDEELIFKRLRLPQGKEVFGRVTEMLSSDRLRVECSDGKERIGRIPGRLRKRVWVRKGDLIIIEPWKIQGDIKGEIVADVVTIGGKVVGTINAKEKTVLESKCTLKGDVLTKV